MLQTAKPSWVTTRQISKRFLIQWLPVVGLGGNTERSIMIVMFHIGRYHDYWSFLKTISYHICFSYFYHSTHHKVEFNIFVLNVTTLLRHTGYNYVNTTVKICQFDMKSRFYFIHNFLSISTHSLTLVLIGCAWVFLAVGLYNAWPAVELMQQIISRISYCVS